MQFFFPFLIALMVTMVLTPLLVRFAGILQLLDTPGERKVHSMLIPRVGGIAMVVAVLVAMAIVLPFGSESTSLFAGIVILLIFGIWDDRSDIDYRIKFMGQFLAVVAVVYFGHILFERLPFISFDTSPIYVCAPITIIFLVGVTNAFNLADGLDGLAAGVTLLSLAAIAVLAHMANGTAVLLITMAVMGSILGFLRYNTYPARIFMGDTGSQFLGYSVGILAVLLTQNANTALSAALPLLLLGFPILDTVMVIWQRLQEGRSPFSADKNHIHHKLLALRFNHYEAVMIIYLIQALFVVGALFLRYESDLLIILLYIGICFGLLALLWVAGRTGWRFHVTDSVPIPGALAKAVGNSRAIREVPLFTLRLAIPVMFLVSALFVNAVPSDLGFAAGVVFVALLLRLTYGYRLWFLNLRLMVFTTAAFIVYLTGIYSVGTELFPAGYEYVYYSVLLVALLVAIRYSKKEVFGINPSDLLLVILVLGLAIIPQERLLEYRLVPSIVKLAILFYGSEFVLRRMESRWNLFTGSVLLTLGVLSMRGFIL